MKLYGTTTSPYVRRVRIAATELGVPYDLVDTTTDAGQSQLRQLTPIWKVPTAVVGDDVVWDSRAITEYLVDLHGAGPLRLAVGADRWRELNLLNAIDGALDAGINTFYLLRDGLSVDSAPYLGKQRARMASALRWAAGQLKGAYFSADERLGLAEIALITTLDWMVFRNQFPIDQIPELAPFMRAHAQRPSIAATYPKQ